MLREITAVRQDSAETQRRWFQDDFFDLFVWQGRDGEFVAFQLCYDIKSNERVLSWKKDKGYTHARIDSGEQVEQRLKMSPLMVADGVFQLYSIAPRFEQAAAGLDGDIRSFVLAKLREYPRALYGPLRKPRRRKSPPKEKPAEK